MQSNSRIGATIVLPVAKSNSVKIAFSTGAVIRSGADFTIDLSPDLTFGGKTNSPEIRSNKYDPITVKMPLEGETIEMSSTISFDTENLIQVYAGRDNIPYTSDDTFVYAPNYWERVNVKLEIK